MSDQYESLHDCPECGKRLIEAGVMLKSNFLTGEPVHPVWRLECPDCTVIVALEMEDQANGWDLWDAQNAKIARDKDNDIPF